MQRFADFKAQKLNFELLRSPFAADMEKTLANIQTGLIEL